jgi:cationic amino acid transporter 4
MLQRHLLDKVTLYVAKTSTRLPKMGGIVEKISRKKPLDHVTPTTSLRRCLTTFDLTLLGMGSMIGSGIYVMTGQVIKEQAGKEDQAVSLKQDIIFT